MNYADVDEIKHEFLKQNLSLLLNRKLYNSQWMYPKPLTKKEIEKIYKETVCMVDELYNKNKVMTAELIELHKERR